MIKCYKRILKYVFRYKAHLAGSITCMLLFVIFSTFSLGLIMPFINVLFSFEKTEIVETTKPAITTDDAVSHNNVKEKNVEELMSTVPDIRAQLEIKMNEWINRYPRQTALRILCIVILIGFFLKNLASVMQTFFISVVEQGVMRDLREEIYTHFHRLSLRFFHGERAGQLISRITNDVTVINASITAASNSLFRDPPMILIYMTILLILSWKLTLVILFLIPVIGFIISQMGNKLKHDSLIGQQRMADLTTIIQETLYGMRVIKAFTMNNKEIENFKRENDSYCRTIIRMTRIRKLSPALNEYVGVIAGSIVLFIGGSEVIDHTTSLSPGGFILYLGALFSMFQPLKLIGQVYNHLKEGMVAADRVFQIIDTTPEIVDIPDPIRMEKFQNTVEYKNVWFSYDGKTDVLKEINFKVNSGQIIAIVGPSGGGKSTLVDLLARFYDPTRGQIEIDGVDLKKLSIDSFRKKLGIVTQETILFHDTIKNNIAYGSEGATEEQIIQAANAANAHQFISEMPDSYATVIGDRGFKLSGGQRQRLAIARAILRNPPILIFDEATSALDTESEMLVQEAIDRLFMGRTSFVIAHRLSTIINADRILVIKNGEIVQSGSHEELKDKKGVYKMLYDMQFKRDYEFEI